jgi:hypothetical protein
MNSFRGELSRFHQFLDSLPYKDKIVVAGNHDFVLDLDKYQIKHKPRRHPYEKMNPAEEVAALRQRCTYLCHEGAEVQGLRVFGSPYQPLYFNWGFQYHSSLGAETW